ncbi:MAG: DUF6265 family protein [Burkholderiaceae bacterium]
MNLRAASIAGVVALSSSVDAAPIDAFAWLAGCWAGERAAAREGEPPRRFEEHWMAPRAGVMSGMSRTTRGETLAEFEFMRIHDEAGTLVFLAQPRGAAPTPFKAVKLDADGATFENPAHDFPQRVIYRRAADGSLAARIEGELQGKPRGVDFQMRRVACPGG